MTHLKDFLLPWLYLFKVHTCSVSDGQGGQTVPVLDSKGFAYVHKFINANIK